MLKVGEIIMEQQESEGTRKLTLDLMATMYTTGDLALVGTYQKGHEYAGEVDYYFSVNLVDYGLCTGRECIFLQHDTSEIIQKELFDKLSIEGAVFENCLLEYGYANSHYIPLKKELMEKLSKELVL